MVDIGAMPPIEMSLDAHAGCLSFEFSSPRQNLIIVNCGLPATARDGWRPFARSTAAHSTVTFNETSSARFVETMALRRVLGGAPMLDGPRQVAVTREDRPDGIGLRARHDGYALRYGVVHERTLRLAADGMRLHGEELFLAADGPAQAQAHGARDMFAVRFHLHPSVTATRLGDGRGIRLMAPNNEVWTFRAAEHQVVLEDSVYLAGPEGPRRTAQIVIRGRASSKSRVLWSLQQAAPGAAAGSGSG
jgi:uncharacterized heparinase superfamily protein